MLVSNPRVVRLASGARHGRSFLLLTEVGYTQHDLVTLCARLVDRGGRGVYSVQEDSSFAVYVVFPNGCDFGPSYVLDIVCDPAVYVAPLKVCNVGAVSAMLARLDGSCGVFRFGGDPHAEN